MCQSCNANSPTVIQRRHIAFGVILVFFSLALIIAEAKRSSSSYVGYWVGAIGLLPSAFAIACGVSKNRYLLTVSCVTDCVAACACVAGAILSLVFFSVHVYAVGWLSVILTTFLLYHAFSVFGELNMCCRMTIFEISDSHSEENDHRHRERECPAPPIGFLMPDEVPKPPNYDTLSVRGDPPAYTENCSQRSLGTPTSPPPEMGPPPVIQPPHISATSILPGDRARHHSPITLRLAGNRHRRVRSRSESNHRRRAASLDSLERN